MVYSLRMQTLILLMILGELSLQDLRFLRIRNRSLIVFSGCGMITILVNHMIYGMMADTLQVLLWEGLLILAAQTGGSRIGSADVWVLAGLPLFLQTDRLWICLLHAFLMASFSAIICYVLIRDRKRGIPFIPFVFGACLLQLS